MDATAEIWLPIHPAAFGVLAAILTAAFIYYVVKFVASILTGG